MRDKKLLTDVLLFLKAQDTRHPLGRVTKDLVERIDDEMKADPDEPLRLLNTFIYLYDNPQSDCQPSKAWETLASKVRFAIKKRREAIARERCAIIDAIRDMLPNIPPQDLLAYYTKFRKEGMP